MSQPRFLETASHERVSIAVLDALASGRLPLGFMQNILDAQTIPDESKARQDSDVATQTPKITSSCSKMLRNSSSTHSALTWSLATILFVVRRLRGVSTRADRNMHTNPMTAPLQKLSRTRGKDPCVVHARTGALGRSSISISSFCHRSRRLSCCGFRKHQRCSCHP